MTLLCVMYCVDVAGEYGK